MWLGTLPLGLFLVALGGCRSVQVAKVVTVDALAAELGDQRVAEIAERVQGSTELALIEPREHVPHSIAFDALGLLEREATGSRRPHEDAAPVVGDAHPLDQPALLHPVHE